MKLIAAVVGAANATLVFSDTRNKDCDPFLLLSSRSDFCARYLKTLLSIKCIQKHIEQCAIGSRFSVETILGNYILYDLEERRKLSMCSGEFVSMFAKITHDTYCVGVLGVHRSVKCGSFSDIEAQWFDKILPHAQAVVKFRLELDALELRLDSILNILDHLTDGAIVLDGNGFTIYTNRIAARIVGERDGLRIIARRPVATDFAAARRLNAIIRRVLSPAPADLAPCCTAALLPRRSLRRPLAITCARLTAAQSHFGQDGRRAAAALFISDPESRQNTGSKAFMRLYELTPAEARMADALCSGLDLNQAAEFLGIRRETARFHLKHLFAKTETRRQVDLVRLLDSGPAHFVLDE